MTIEQVIEYCNELSNKMNDSFSIPVTVNPRLTKTLGRVCGTINNLTDVCTPEKMEISKKLLDHGTEEDIKRVVAHEFAHYYLMKTTKENHGHDKMFNELSVKLGGNPGTSTVIEGYRDVKSKYEVFCPNCGRIGTYSRMCSTLKNISSCSCTACKSKELTMVQNW